MSATDKISRTISTPEIVSALQFARQQLAIEEAVIHVSAVDTAVYHSARYARALWAGRVAAYEYVLCLEPGETTEDIA